jgi:hypothetical protein
VAEAANPRRRSTVPADLLAAAWPAARKQAIVGEAVFRLSSRTVEQVECC